ncbi:MAG: peptidoglycan DD-metalloendopeptidase family protein [Chitinispirillales bacterium]|jgi:murein DD-endopeptidase MepM/ murein hydrolase activator NlpD|nr:peptidoglycan DD-metalloendopeptidase family protein [Chitinispirillales bacterium]
MSIKFLCRIPAFLTLIVAFAFAHYRDNPSDSAEVDFARAYDDYVARAVDAVVGDSAAAAEFREEWGQDFSSLFDDDDIRDYGFAEGIDTTFAWSNYRINAGRFDYRTLGPEDTIKIMLIDTAQGKHYFHPHPGRVTSPFGPRRFLWHYGIDTKLDIGDTVLNAFDGIVRVVQFERRGYGHVVVVRHHNGLETLYAHLHRVDVEPNQRIRAGEPVGLGGNTGRSTGPHLHFEIRYLGEPFNPTHIIDFQKHALKSDTLILTHANFEYLTVQRQTLVHTVRRGETLGSIARRYGTTVNNLCRLNGITSRTIIRPGQRLVIRRGDPSQTQVASASGATPPGSVAADDAAVDTGTGGAAVDDADVDAVDDDDSAANAAVDTAVDAVADAIVGEVGEDG